VKSRCINSGERGDRWLRVLILGAADRAGDAA
jgi:hypothetical protein